MRRILRPFLLVAAVVVAADQLTKWWALENLSTSCAEPDGCIDLIAGARFRLVFNTGAAFTSGSDYGPVLAVIAFFMSGFLLVLAARRPDRIGSIFFALIAGGAIGNLVDRVFRAEGGWLNGAVVDFVDLGWWPVFNVADSAIVVGVIAGIAHSFFYPPDESPSEATDPQAADDGDSLEDAAEGSGDSSDSAEATSGDDRSGLDADVDAVVSDDSAADERGRETKAETSSQLDG